MRVLQETPDRLVVEGATVVASMAGAFVKMALMVLALPCLAFAVFSLQMAVTYGELRPGLIVAAVAGTVTCIVLALRTRRADLARGLAPTPGARQTVFDARAGVVNISGVGSFPLQDVRCAFLDSPEDCGCMASLSFYDREAVSLSTVYIPEEDQVQEVVNRIERFLARLPKGPRRPAPAPAPRQPSVYQAQTKEEFERALQARCQEMEGRQGSSDDEREHEP
jgi:hypothetical protein